MDEERWWEEEAKRISDTYDAIPNHVLPEQERKIESVPVNRAEDSGGLVSPRPPPDGAVVSDVVSEVVRKLEAGDYSEFLELNEEQEEVNNGTWKLEESDDEEEQVEVTDLVNSINESAEINLLRFMPSSLNVQEKKRSWVTATPSTPPPPPTEEKKGCRRLTQIIAPTPQLIPEIEHLAKTNNRSLSQAKEMNWEDGAPDVQAPDVTRVSDTSRLVQRIRELKMSNQSMCNDRRRDIQSSRLEFSLNQTVRLNQDGMSVSHLMRNVPDMDEEPASLLSVGDTTSFIYADFGHNDNRKLAHLLPTDDLLSLENNNSDENRNEIWKSSQVIKEYNSVLFDSTFAKDHVDEQTRALNGTYRACSGQTAVLDATFSMSDEEPSPPPQRNDEACAQLSENRTFSTATFSRSTVRTVLKRSGIARMAAGNSSENLAPSPARNRGDGTFTRNSPVPDEQMSSASDTTSQGSVEELSEKIRAPHAGAESTPQNGAVPRRIKDCPISPISSIASSTESLPNKPLQMPILRPPLVRPVANFKRAIKNKAEIGRQPMASGPVRPGLPQPPPTRIPRPGSSRPTTLKKDSNRNK